MSTIEGVSVTEVVRLTQAHREFPSSILCDSQGKKNTLGYILANAGFRNDQLIKMKPIEMVYNLSNRYRYSITTPQAALVVYVNNIFHKNHLLGQDGQPIVDEGHAIEFALIHPDFYLGDKAQEILSFLEQIRNTFQNHNIMEVVSLLKPKDMPSYNGSTPLKSKLSLIYGENLGPYYADAAKGITELSLSGKWLNARGVPPYLPNARKFKLLVSTAIQEMQVAAKVGGPQIFRSLIMASVIPQQRI